MSRQQTHTVVPSEIASPRKRRTAADLAARAVLLGLLGRMREGAIIVNDGGHRHLCGRPVAGEIVPEIEVLDATAWRVVAAEGSAGLGRTYFEGGWRTESIEDLTTFLRIMVRNLSSVDRASALRNSLQAPLRRSLTRREQRPGRQDVDRSNIKAHYDLGNDVFELFLDETMAYSCALFTTPQTSLHDAQVEKFDRICRKLSLSPVDDVIEIGTGWGGFAIHAARRYGCRVTTTTISDRQFELATRRVRDAGLTDLVTVLNEDYRNLTGAFDKLVSIEMIEALDWRQYDTYFGKCADLLKPGGAMALQAIVMADRYFDRAKRTEDFIKRYIFPGSCIPSLHAILSATSHSSDLQLVSLEDIGVHYAETLRRWHENFAAQSDKLLSLGYDDQFMRLFAFYFSYCEAAFAERRIGDVQCFFAKPLWRPDGLGSPVS